MRRRPPEFDLEYDEDRAEGGLPRVDEASLARIEARLRTASRAGEGAAVSPVEVEVLLAALDALRRHETAGLGTAALDEDLLDT
jgi:hypothetical protein